MNQNSYSAFPEPRIILAKCTSCGSEFSGSPSQKDAPCPYCGKKNVVCFTGAQEQVRFGTDAVMQQETPPKKRHTLLWVLGWLIIFPLPLTILMLRLRKPEKKIRLGIIAASWILYFILMAISASRNNDNSNSSTVQPSETGTSITEVQQTTAPPQKTEQQKQTDIDTETTALSESSEDGAKTTKNNDISASDIRKMVEKGDYSLVTPSFKKTMDAYEAFYDDYIAFMKKYSENEANAIEMLNDYMSMMGKLEEWGEKIDSIDEENLSPADDAYFLLVTVRIEKKLLSSLGTIE
ncbi:MAG: hypothetical protein IKI58_09965 [Oscillospiraceae bacterium]|nr:hypothetical protein [Oscillospiraceae bacterium]